MRKAAYLGITVLLLTLPATGTEVWTSNFDTDGDPDGVVDIYDLNLNKVMIGGPSGGRLSILQHDEPPGTAPPVGYPYLPDEAGRPLGSTLTAADSFSGLYRFRWSQYWGDPVAQDGSIAWELAGFLGESSGIDRQVVAALVNHWQIANGTYYVRLWTIVGDNSKSCARVATGSIPVGPNPQDRDFELAVGWDGTTNTIRVELIDPLTGATVGAGSTVITDSECIDNLQMQYLGWSDYTSNPPSVIKPVEWSVDSLAYYDTFEEAFPVPLQPGKIWESTFDVDGAFDGFVDVYSVGRLMMNTNGAEGGTLRVKVVDDDTSGTLYNGNKSGRPFGQVLAEPDSWSALYKFRWTDLPERETPQAYQFAGAFGANQNQTRQVVGALMQHWKVDENYYVNLGLMMGGIGGERINLSGPARLLGPNAETTDYQLAIGWDTDADELLAGLYLADGTPVGTNAIQVFPITVPTPLVTDYQMIHLGWGDYTGDPLVYDAIYWEVDSVAFWYGLPMAAFDEAVCGARSDLDCDGDVDLDDYVILGNCLAGPDVTVPPGGCMQSDFEAADIDNDLDVDVGDFSLFQVDFPA